MSEQPSEEKALPPSAKKLRDARKKGQVAHPKDIVVAIATTCAFGWLVATGPAMIEKLKSTFTIAADASTRGLREGIVGSLPKLVEIAGDIVLPFVALLVMAAVLANIIVLKGVMFAIEPIIPKYEKIDPISGFQRIFSVKNLVELLKSIGKMLLVGGLVVGMVAVALNDILHAPRCGPGCLGGIFGAMFSGVAIGVSALFLSVGLLDVGLQHWLFRRDMRMTRTEAKRERKDQDGDPHVRSERRRRRKEMLTGPSKVGLRHATILIADPSRSELVVALRYVRGETPVPIVVAKARGERVAALCDRAHARRIVVADDAELGRALLVSGAALGEYVPQPLFAPVAQCIVRHCGLPT